MKGMNRDVKTGLIVIGVVIVLSIAFSLFFSTSGIQSPTTGTVMKIPITGAISTTGSSSLFESTLTSKTIADKIESANEDTAIDAILLVIDSPGGAPVASHEIARAVEEADKPVASQIREVGASGAYWVASSSDYIVSDPVSITGSVGVLSSYLDFSGLLSDYNVTYQRFVNGEYKDLGTPYKPLEDDERRKLQSKIDLLGEYFLDDVVEKRGLSERQKQQIQTAEFFIGVESIDVGLVDELGGEDEAIAWLENQTDMSLSTTEAQFQRGFFQSLGGMSLKSSPDFMQKQYPQLR